MPATAPTIPDPPPTRRQAAWAMLKVACSLGGLMVAIPSLVMATFLVAIEVSYRVVLAFTAWRTFVMPAWATVALFLSLGAAIWAGLLWPARRYVNDRADRIAHRLRAVRDLARPAPAASPRPDPGPHLAPETAR